MNLTRSNQTVQYQGSATNPQSYANYAISGDNDRTVGCRGEQKNQRIISISDDMIIISANQLEARVKSLEESVMQLNRSTMVFQT